MDVYSLSERLRKEAASLGRRKGREAAEQFLIEGVRSVEAAIEGGAEIEQVLVHERMLDHERVQRMLEKSDARVFSLNDKQEKSISTVETSSGCMAIARYKRDALDDVLSMNAVVVLDGVQDPGNVGTIIRTAAWFGIEGVLTGSGTADIYNPKTVRSTMGGLWETCCVRVDDLERTLHLLKGEGYALAGTFMDGSALSAWTPKGKTAIIIGSEAHGIDASIAAIVDQRIAIPGGQGRATESLNAATAASIVMYQYAAST